jgi:hypothetical protein
MQTTGAEWKKFIADDAFWEDKWLEEWVLEIDGKTYSSDNDDIDLTQVSGKAKITIQYGCIVDGKGSSVLDLKKFFTKWKKEQTTVHLVIEAPKDKLNAIKKAVKTAGGKVV